MQVAQSVRMGGGAGLINSAANILASIEADPLKALVITDVGGMVLPRSWIEYKERGVISANETFFREIAATFTNCLISGWFGLLALLGFKAYRNNPKGMNFKAHIDAKSLDAFGRIVREVLRKPHVQSAQDVQRDFLKTVLGRLKSTDVIPNLPEFREYFPAGGKLEQNAVSRLVNRYLGKVKGYPHHAFANIEQRVVAKMKLPEYREEIQSAIAEARQKFMAQHGEGKLISFKRALLKGAELVAERQAAERQKARIRQEITRGIRQSEGRFLDSVYKLAIHQGKLSDEVFLLDGANNPVKGYGIRTTKDMLGKIKYFMEEFLNRSLANPTTGVVGDGPLNKAHVRRTLFTESGANWLQKKIIPNAKDGLLAYAYKRKNFIVFPAIAMTIFLGCLTVIVNNWLTRRKTGGETYFPGEKALMEKELGKTGAKSATGVRV